MFKNFLISISLSLLSINVFAQAQFENVSNLQLCIDYINSTATQNDKSQIERANELSKRNENCQQYVELAKARKTNIVPERSFLEKLADGLIGAGSVAPPNNPSTQTVCRQMGRELICDTR